LQVALIIDTLKPEFVVASTVRHSFLALPEYIYPSANMLSPQTGVQSRSSCPVLCKVSEN